MSAVPPSPPDPSVSPSGDRPTPDAPTPGGVPPARLAHVWAELERAAASARHGWHLPVVATTGSDGAPDARIVVLRRVDVAGRLLVFHTDRRSPKCAQLAGNGAAALVFYDASRREQLRASGTATIHRDDAFADARWESGSDSSLRCYLAPRAPSSAAAAPSPNLPPDARDVIPPRRRLEEGRDRFAVVAVRVERLDWLHLAHDGHERIGWTFDGDAPGTTPSGATWLEP